MGKEKFTIGEFIAVNMKTCHHQNVRKNREIKGSDKYVTLDISLKFDILDKMRIKCSESKVIYGRSGLGLITSLVINSKTTTKKYKKARYAIGNPSLKYPSKIIREFEKLPYKSYERMRPKNEPTYHYLYLAGQLE